MTALSCSLLVGGATSPRFLLYQCQTKGTQANSPASICPWPPLNWHGSWAKMKSKIQVQAWNLWWPLPPPDVLVYSSLCKHGTIFFQSPFLFFFRSCSAHPHLSAYASETHQGPLITWLGSQDPELFVFTFIAVTFVSLTRILLPVAIANVQRLFSRYIIYVQLRDNRMTQFPTLTIPSHLSFPQWHIIIFWACSNGKKNLLYQVDGPYLFLLCAWGHYWDL